MSYKENYKPFKIIILKHNSDEEVPYEIDKIYVFVGNTDKEFHYDDEDIYVEGFDEEDKYIEVESYIHTDDTIDTIKQKICSQRGVLSESEIYLFGEYEKELDPDVVYRELTQNETVELTDATFVSFFRNFTPGQHIKELMGKIVYDYNDFLTTNISHGKYRMNVPIGQICEHKNISYPFTVNPYKVVQFDKLLSKETADSPIATQNRNILFNVGNIVNNNIYLCNVDDVLKFVAKSTITNSWNPKLFIKIYFPYLFKKKIYTKEKYNSEKAKLKSSKREKNKEYNKHVDLFYDLYNQPHNKWKFANEYPIGIKDLQCVIHLKKHIKFPLDIIFKLIHATEQIPFIKYNPGTHKEKIYRIFTNQVSQDGRKIPMLGKGAILNLRKNLARHNQVGFIINYNREKKYRIILQFFQ